jgi:argininosuccinate synthase
MKERIVLAYSGSPATSAAVRWLMQEHAADIVTLTLDFGAGGELQEIHERALAVGAARAHAIDVREEFANDYVLPALQAGALHGRGETLDGLARPLIAKKLVEIARIERAVAVAHGATPASGIDTLIHALDPDVRVIDAGSTGPGLRDGDGAPEAAAPREARKSVPATPDNGADVEITFERDVPVAINGVPMSLTELIESLTIIATQHGITGVGAFSGAPAITVLQAAFNARLRDEATCVVRLKLMHGVTSSDVPGSEVPSSELAAPRS